MTAKDAVHKAWARHLRSGNDYLAVHRPYHPVTKGDWCYCVAVDDKHLWSAGETVLVDTRTCR